MKTSITTTTTFQYILLFTFLFAAFLALAITYNKVYKLKNETVSIIEKYEGISSTSLEVINNYLRNSGYNTKGNCASDEYGVADLNNHRYEEVNSNKKYYYCLKDSIETNRNGDKIYYDVKLFFKFNLPVIGDLLTFKITGETKGIRYYDKIQELKNKI